MNEELQNAVINLINKTTGGAEASIDFLSGQLPDYIMQLLMWYGLRSGIMFLAGVSAIVIAFILQKNVILAKDNDGKLKHRTIYTHIPDCHVNIVGSSVIMWGFVAFISSILINLTWLKIWIAPKVFLVDYAASLIK